MERRQVLGIGGTIALVLIALGAAFLLGRPATVERQQDPSHSGEPPADGSAIVLSTRRSGGFSLFGLEFSSPDHFVRVQFRSLPDCADLVAIDDPWPAPEGCPGPIGIVGEVAGLGRTATGDSLVAVDVEITEACYDAVELGSPWPPGITSCEPGA